MQIIEVLKQKPSKNQKQIILNYQNIREIGLHNSFMYITTLCLSHNCIQHLDGIEQFVQLTTLSLHHNLIQSVNELNKIKQPHLLKLLNVHHNPFTVNPTYSTVILQKFCYLEQLDNQRLNKQYYQQYFHWIKCIGQLLIPYLNENCVSEQLVNQLSIELKKYEICIFKLNSIIYTHLINFHYSNQHTNQQLQQSGEQVFSKLLDILNNNQKSNDLQMCLMNQALQDQEIDLFEFQSNNVYKQQCLYQNFLQLNDIIFKEQQFCFPYFPLCLDYVKSIIELIKIQFKRQNKYVNTRFQQTSLQSYRQQSVEYQENTRSNHENNQQSINKTKSSQSIGRMKNNTNKSILTSQSQLSHRINHNSVSIFVRVLNNFTKKQTEHQQQLVFDFLRKRAHIQQIFEKIMKRRQIGLLKHSFTKVKQLIATKIIAKVTQPILYNIKEEAFNIMLRLKNRYEAKQLEKSVEHFEIQRKRLVFSILLINQQQMAQQKQALFSLIKKQRQLPLREHFQRWKIYSISEQFYDQIFQQKSNEIRSLASISTRNEMFKKYPTKSIQFLESNSTLDQDGNKQQKRNSTTSINQHLKNNGTNIYCEYVVINKLKKKKKKKSLKNSKSKKESKSKQIKNKCGICRDYLDENGNIIEKKEKK
ncbi:unnamed protein product (macronuclear) [Paramecium tetraurelia]|uniref:Uncharacterized protein n=1 Tax=Paramecium tetraurelia TaxID=5888 RepID=A0DLE8_PARTE|nr:uncharacterized protein GSPATT00018182001 [Paramecium tetraurelia]CAK83865.1 unnamed protein product [Paramecium tetraurelia]|eukprot:XP_001451262.1 hypothetical protein (macronuclear) [Paramecium tetraurelia strain d4-2]